MTDTPDRSPPIWKRLKRNLPLVVQSIFFVVLIDLARIDFRMPSFYVLLILNALTVAWVADMGRSR